MFTARSIVGVVAAFLLSSSVATPAHGQDIPALVLPDFGAGGTQTFKLSAAFPELDVTASYGFADDRGMGLDVLSTTVAGSDKAELDVLAAVVAHRKGWGLQGEGSDEQVLWNLEAFVTAWSALRERPMLTDAAAPVGFDIARKKNRLLPAYHPPRYAIVELEDGTRLAVASYYTRQFQDTGPRGRKISEEDKRTRFALVVWAHDVATGARARVAEAGERLRSAKPKMKGALPRPVEVIIPGCAGL